MSSSQPLRLFISYARRDGAALAQRLQSDLTKAGFDAWLDTGRIVGGAVWSMEVEREIDARQVTLALLSPSSYASDICRAEQLRALDKGNRVIPVLALKGADRPLYLYARQYRDFTNDANYSERFDELLADIRGDATASLPDKYRKTTVTYLTAPPRVANYLERTEALRALRDAVFAEDHRQPIALTALAGMGGIGKTVLAKALTEDEVVQRAFPDGIVWLTAGKERKRDFIEEMREVAKALGDDLSRYDNALACENQYRTTIANKAALIVVDDVWSKADIEPLLAESPRSRFLFTTRDASIGRFVGAHEQRADLLDVAQSRQVLALWARVPLTELPATTDELIAECGRLPLALSVVGAMLCGAEAQFWRDTLELLRKADLSAIQELLPEGQDSFFKAVAVSFRSLKPEMQKRYKALAVLLEDMVAPLTILEALWNVTKAEARRTSRQFVDRSLAQRDGVAENIRLHDLQLDYVRAQYPDKKALDLIRGAVRLSSHVIARNPGQFVSQMIGRLLPLHDLPAIERFATRLAEGTRTPWLRPLRPALDPPGAALIRTLPGHEYAVTAVALTCDGRRAVSASKDSTLKLWELETGRELLTLIGHKSPVAAVAVTPDGQYAVSASSDHTLKVWDLAGGIELRTLTGHSDYVWGVAVTPDGRYAVSASRDCTMKVWELGTGRELRTLTGHKLEVTAVAATPDGRCAVSASADHTLKIWELDSGRELRTITGHSDAVNALAVARDGYWVVSVSSDGTMKIWELDTGRELRTITQYGSDPTALALTPDGRWAISGSSDGTLMVWELASGRDLCSLTGHHGRIWAVTVTPDGHYAISASSDNTLRMWDLTRARELRTPTDHRGPVNAVAVTSDGKRAVSASDDQMLKVWEVDSGLEQRALGGHRASIWGVAVTSDGQCAISASGDDTLKLWHLESGRELRTFTGHTGPVYAVVVTSDRQRAVSSSNDSTLKVWNLESGSELRTLTGHLGAVFGVGLTPDGQLAVSASKEGTLKVWDLGSGRELRTLTSHTKVVNAVAVTPDGRYVVSGSADQTLRVWDMASGRALRTLTGHTGPVYAVVVTSDRQRAVSASADNTLKVWDLQTGEVIADFTCDSSALCCAFSEVLQVVIAGDAGGHLHFLRLEEVKKK